MVWKFLAGEMALKYVSLIQEVVGRDRSITATELNSMGIA